jgi:hypothetical protein
MLIWYLLALEHWTLDYQVCKVLCAFISTAVLVMIPAGD